MQPLSRFKRCTVSTQSHIQCFSRRRSKSHHHHRHNYNRYSYDGFNYFKVFGGASSMVFGASMIRYMEPKTNTTFSDKFETEDGDLLDIIFTGYHKWRSMGDKSYVFMNEFNKTFTPHFCYAVYRKKFTMEQALEFEKKNINVDSYEIITTNDFPYHYNRAKKKRLEELKQIQDEKWQKASDEERRVIYDEIQDQKRKERMLKDLRYDY